MKELKSSSSLVSASNSSAALWICLYFLANLTLTIHNKWVLNRINFSFPWTLTAIHISVSGAGSFLVCKLSGMDKPVLDRAAWTKLLAFSVLYALNIAMSNVSLAYVSLSFHQIVRSSVPAFILMLETMLLGKQHSISRKASLIPLIVGVALSTLGEYRDIYFTYIGLTLTMVGVILAALKGVATNILMVGSLSLHPLEVIYTMALPATLQCLLYGATAGEFHGMMRFVEGLREKATIIKLVGGPTSYPVLSLVSKLALNGFLAFLLNWVSFTANQKTSALTMTVVANVKQIASISLAIYIFNTPLTRIKLAGILLTLVGATWYSFSRKSPALQVGISGHGCANGHRNEFLSTGAAKSHRGKTVLKAKTSQEPLLPFNEIAASQDPEEIVCD